MRIKLIVSLVIILLLVAYFILGMDYMKQRKAHEVLTSQITDVTQTLAQTPKSLQTPEQRLAEAKASLAAEQNTFPGKQNSTQVINSILTLADDCQLRTTLVAQPWLVENVGEHGYHVFRLNLAVEGSFSQLVSFVSKLENGEFKTLMVEDLSVKMATEQSEEASLPEENIAITATLDVAIYTQSVTAD